MPERLARKLLAGKRTFPLEDCGGVWGYQTCLAAIGLAPTEDFDKDELEERRDWLDDWRPEEFDLEKAREMFDG